MRMPIAPAISAIPVKVTQKAGSPRAGGTMRIKSSRNPMKCAPPVRRNMAATPTRNASGRVAKRLRAKRRVPARRARSVTTTRVISGAMTHPSSASFSLPHHDDNLVAARAGTAISRAGGAQQVPARRREAHLAGAVVKILHVELGASRRLDDPMEVVGHLRLLFGGRPAHPAVVGTQALAVCRDPGPRLPPGSEAEPLAHADRC